MWTAAAKKHNDGLVKRRQAMMDAWKMFSLHSPPDERAAAEAWLKARAAAQHKVGMDPVFE